MYDIERLKELMFTDYPDLVDVAQLQEMLAVNRHTAEYSAPVEHPGRLKLNTLVAVG